MPELAKKVRFTSGRACTRGITKGPLLIDRIRGNRLGQPRLGGQTG